MYRALIVCNSRFRDDPSLIELYGPKMDGIVMRDSLIDPKTGMFSKDEVKVLPEAGSQQVCDAMEEFFRSAEADDTLLFYYSGHGIRAHQQLFLCTENTNSSKLFTSAIPQSTINGIMDYSPAKTKIIVLDCCHSGQFKGDDITKGLSGIGRYIIAASSATERANDARSRGMASPFTRILADGLTGKALDRDGDGYIDLDDIYSYLGSTPYGGPRPRRTFDGAGAVPVARRVRPALNGRRQSTDDNATDNRHVSPEPPTQALSYMDTIAPGSRFSPEKVNEFRANIRSEQVAGMPQGQSPEEFLEYIGVMRDHSLTYAGVLLFGKNPNALFPAAMIQCVRFHGTRKTDPLEATEFYGTAADMIVQTRDFVASNARIGETATAQSAFAETAYRYPMVAVREIIANAVVHRNYEDQSSCVQIHMFDDRIEVMNPGQWGGTPVPAEGESPLSQLERQSERRNFRLARTLGLSKLVEGVGAGVPRAVADSEAAGAQEPVVIVDGRSVTVRIFPRALEEIPDLGSGGQLQTYRPGGRGRNSPMYVRIADELRAQIRSGALEAGEMLPTETELREQYGASRNTIRDAVKRLTSEGMVETRPGQGTFVAPRIDPFVTVLTADPATTDSEATYLSQVSAQNRRPRTSTPRVEVQVPSAEVAKRLRIPAGEMVISRHQVRYIDDIPWSLETSFYPMEFVTRGASRLLMAEEIPEGTVRYLAEMMSINQVGYRDWITARIPEEHEQAFFRIAHNGTVFENFRTAFDQFKKPMRVTVTVFPADRNQFIVNFGDVPDPRYDDQSFDRSDETSP